jgi:hypothetical protein
MNVITLPSSHPFGEALWLRVGLSERLDPTAFDSWRDRLQVFLLPRGLIAAIAAERVAVRPLGRPLTSDDRVLVFGWLVAQPEVVFVHVDRRTRSLARSSNAAQEPRRG